MEFQHIDMNLELKKARVLDGNPDAENHVKKILTESQEIRAVTVCFSDIEGRLHMLDYDKQFLLKNSDNLTFDGSSIRGFTAQHESDLKLVLDWAASYLLPSDFFGSGKLYMFGEVRDKDGSSYSSDVRSILRDYLETLRENKMRVNVAAEIEGFVFKGIQAEQKYFGHFEPVTQSGYFNTLPLSPLRQFIDDISIAQRSAGFENEKDHGEVAPSQFEVNWGYTEALVAADQIQLYKMMCRQVASYRGWTACFLPKPSVSINGNGMHVNMSLSKGGKNLFYDKKGEHGISESAMDFIHGILNRAEDLCLVLNSSVNAYRRLDPAYEAPNEIKYSSVDRGSMIRIPIGNERSARIEVRTVAPDANPYLVIYSLLKAGLSDKTQRNQSIPVPRQGVGHNWDVLPSDIYTAMRFFEESSFMKDILSDEVHKKYLHWKREAADRCPRLLGNTLNNGEILYHHEVTNQNIWAGF